MKGRRQFCRALAGLGCAGLGACKIEPRLDVRERDGELPPNFPDPPPQIPDALQSAENTLRASTQALLDRQQPLFESGLRERAPEEVQVVKHFVDLMRSFGLSPAANRGGWLQPVALEIVEPRGAQPRVMLRLESLPSTLVAQVNPPPEPPPEQGEEQAPEQGEGTQPEEPSEGEGGEAEPEPSMGEGEDEGEGEEGPTPFELAALGAFRQRGEAVAHEGLPLSPLLEYETPLPPETIEGIVGRVALFEAPDDFDLGAADATARVDLLMAEARDAGALGCLMLTRADEAGLEQLRVRWRRQVRRAGSSAGAMLIEGLLGDAAREGVERVLASEQDWVLDLDLATQDLDVISNNVIGRITGRERPDEAVVLTCAWDTSPDVDRELATRRLLTTLAAFHQLAEWSRRSTPPPYSLVLLLTVNAGLSAGSAVHAGWSSEYGADTRSLVALSRPSPEPMPVIELSGRYDSGVATLASAVVSSDGRDLIMSEQLSMPSLAPYLRYKAPIICVGAPDPEALVDRAQAEPEEPEQEQIEAEQGGTPHPDSHDDGHAGLFADIRLLRNLVLALAAG